MFVVITYVRTNTVSLAVHFLYDHPCVYLTIYSNEFCNFTFKLTYVMFLTTLKNYHSTSILRMRKLHGSSLIFFVCVYLPVFVSKFWKSCVPTSRAGIVTHFNPFHHSKLCIKITTLFTSGRGDAVVVLMTSKWWEDIQLFFRTYAKSLMIIISEIHDTVTKFLTPVQWKK